MMVETKMATVAIDRSIDQLYYKRVPQIFICHSSLDKTLLDEVESVIRNEKVEPFIANRKILGKNPVEKVIQAMSNSDALFAVLTKNALKDQSTRDWVFFEIGLAKGMWKNLERKVHRHYEVFGWKDVTISLPSDCPINLITDYRPLKPRSRKSRNEMLGGMKSITKDLSMLLYVS
jgi:hypothetical protein